MNEFNQILNLGTQKMQELYFIFYQRNFYFAGVDLFIGAALALLVFYLWPKVIMTDEDREYGGVGFIFQRIGLISLYLIAVCFASVGAYRLFNPIAATLEDMSKLFH
jgi:hypothetical protein